MCFVPAKLIDTSDLYEALWESGAVLVMKTLDEQHVHGPIPVVVKDKLSLTVEQNDWVYAFGGFGAEEGNVLVYVPGRKRVVTMPRTMSIALVLGENATMYVTSDYWCEYLLGLYCK